MKMTAIIDGDIPIFTECAVAAGRGNDFGAYFPDIVGLADAASFTIELWAKNAQADEIILVHGHPSKRNFRKHLLPLEYKAMRTQPKPAGYNEVLETVISRFKCHAIDGVEGDDTCGILHTSEILGPTVTVSTDKDFKTIPGWIYNPNKQHVPEWVSVNEAAHFWMWQVLVGDSADGYKGCKSVGKVKADKMLGRVDEMAEQEDYAQSLYAAVLQAYEHTYVDKDEAYERFIMQARMARILHRQDYKQHLNVIRLWDLHEPEWLDLTTW